MPEAFTVNDFSHSFAPSDFQGGDEADQGELAKAEHVSDLASKQKEARLSGEKSERAFNLAGNAVFQAERLQPQNIVGTVSKNIVDLPYAAGHAINPGVPPEAPRVDPEAMKPFIRHALTGNTDVNVGEENTTTEGVVSGTANVLAGLISPETGLAIVSGSAAPELITKLFVTDIAGHLPEAADRLIRAKTPKERAAAGVELAAQAGTLKLLHSGMKRLGDPAELDSGMQYNEAANRAAVNSANPGTVRPQEQRLWQAPEIQAPEGMIQTDAAWKQLVPKEFHVEVTEGVKAAADRIRLAQQRAAEIGQSGKLPEGGQEFVSVADKPGFERTAEEALTAGEQETGREQEQIPVVTESTPLQTVSELVKDALEKRDWVRAVSVLGQKDSKTSVKIVNKLLGVGRDTVPLSAGERTIFNTIWDETVKQTGGAEAWADNILNRDPRSGGSQMGLDPLAEAKRIAALAIKGAILIGRGATDFATWSREMIKEHGPSVRPLLKQAFDAAQRAPMSNDRRSSAQTGEAVGPATAAEVAKTKTPNETKLHTETTVSPASDEGAGRRATGQQIDPANASAQTGGAPVVEDSSAAVREVKPSSPAELELAKEPTNPVERRPQFRAQPGEDKTVSQKLGNAVNSVLNAASVTDKAVLPIDAVMDILGEGKGTYDGWLFKHVRGPLDDSFNRTFNRADAARSKFEQIVKDNNLGDDASERIGVYADVLQGQRARMIYNGIKPEVIDRIVNSMQPEELMAYDAMREAMDKQLPEVQALMKRLYDVDVQAVENYFPMPRDHEVFEGDPPDMKTPKAGSEVGFDEMATLKALNADLVPRNTTKTRQGMTVTRKPGARTPTKLNAFDRFRQNIQDVSHLLETQENLKSIGEVARSDTFKEKYGAVGQKIVLDFLDTVSKQGGVESFRRWKLLDVLRRNLSAAAIAFRPVSQVIHLSNVPLAMSHVGPAWYFKGFRESLTPEGQKFLRANFRETFERSGGEPSQAELKAGAVKRVGFAVSRGIDRENAQVTVLAAYLRELQRKGIDPDTYASQAPNVEAIQKARVIARRAVASPLPKDVPQAISRGALTGGNVSLGRSMFQFGNILLDQWSNIRNDLWQAGIRNVNPKQATKIAAGLAGVLLVETGIRMAGKQAMNSATGTKPKKEEEQFAHKLLADVLRKIPFAGQVMNAMLYHETGVPVLDNVVGEAGSIAKIATAKKPESKQKALIKAVGGAAQLYGVPGSGIATELLEKGSP